MEDGKWLRFLTIGLVLAAMAVGYFLLAQRFTGTRVSKSQPTPTSSSILGTNSQTPKPSGLGQDTKPAGGVSQLPATGFPILLIGVFAAGAIIAGFGLRKFPH